MADDRDTATIDLSRGESRVVIAALADEEMTASGDRARRLRDVQDHLAAEFDFDEYRGSERGEMAGDEDEGWFGREWFDSGSGEGSEETVEFSRREAADVAAALADYEVDPEHGNAGVADEVRERILDAFGGEDDLLL
ncbi:hypothetical protein BRD15_09650 [Halobacteriales archaeon SW_6_65_15]|jgi:hypothetical protein|nr:MAG: hypothetical protein BRD15_09650 [Halobacteriales archaeon SW_6_65_15]